MKYLPIGAYTTRFDFSRQGQDALRVEFRIAGTETWQLAETFTASPGEHTVTPTVAGQPVAVEYRCRLIYKNEQVGQWSPIYTVFVTP